MMALLPVPLVATANISAILSILVVIIGGVCTLLIISTKTLRDSRDDQEKRITFLEGKSKRDDETIAQQANDLLVWQNAVTGDAKLTDILTLLNTHHDEAVTNWGGLTTSLTHLTDTLDTFTEAATAFIEEQRKNSD